MADVDTSIYKSTVAPLDPLKTFGQVVGIQNAQQQNKLLQQQQDLRAGMGEAFRQAVGPDGKVDHNKLLAIVSQDPRTAWNFGDVNQQTQGNVTATAQAQQEQLKNLQAHTLQAHNAIIGMLGRPDVGKVDMHDQIVQAIDAFDAHPSTQMEAGTVDRMKQSVPVGDPAAQRQWLVDRMNDNFAMQGQIEKAIGSQVQVDTGPKVVGGVQLPASQGGALVMPSQPGVAKATGPDANAQLITVTQPDGTQVMVPRSSLPGASGLSGPSNRLTAPQPTQPSAARAMAPPAPASAAAAPPVPTAGGAVLAAAPPGVTASQGADVARYKADQAAIPTRATNVQSLQKAKIALEALSGATGTGKGTEDLAHLKAVMSSLGIGFDESTLNRDEAKKYLLDYAKSQGAAGHSDAQLNAALGSNASTEISNQAALDVVKTNIGRERQAIAQTQEQANPTGIGYGQHASSFATKTDPRAFAWDQYTGDERKKILGNLKGDALKKFKDSLVIADRLGLIQKPQ